MKTFLIQEIAFSSESKNVTCCGILNVGHLALNTKIHLDFRQLNRLLNNISKKLNSDEFYEMMEEEQTSLGTYYHINFEGKDLCPIPIHELNDDFSLPLRISA